VEQPAQECGLHARLAMNEGDRPIALLFCVPLVPPGWCPGKSPGTTPAAQPAREP